MSTKIPSSLKWLIDKRARLEAEIRKTRASIQAANGLLNELADLEASLAALDKTFELHDIKIDLSLIEPVNSHYTRINLPQGELTKSVLLCLKLRSHDRIVGSKEIAAFVEARHSDWAAKPENSKKLNHKIKNCLSRLYHQGIVVRHHDQQTGSQGLWTLAEFD